MTFAEAFGVFGTVLAFDCGAVAFAARQAAARSEGRKHWLIGGWLAVHAVLLLAHPPSLLLSNALVLGSAAGGSILLQRFIPTPGALAALAVAASVADIVSFTAGPTRWLLGGTSGETWVGLPYLAATVPVAGRAVPVVGIGDLLLFATFFLALTRFGAGRFASFGIPLIGLLVALGVGLWRGGAFGIPFMTAGVLALLWLRMRRQRAPITAGGSRAPHS